MPYYTCSGEIPHKRHTQFRKPSGELYAELFFSTEGFSNDYSLLYHAHPPTKIIKTILLNKDCQISLAAPEIGTISYFYKNADADELIFVHEGTGVLNTQYGDLAFGPGDYLIIPRGTIYQLKIEGRHSRLFIVESFSPIRFPKRYLSRFGQLLEHAPYCEGDFLIRTKKQGVHYGLRCAWHPFDVVGWDGCCYPFAFSIHDFEPITGRVHQPPPVHQTFEGHNFVVCSFCPRLFDYHPLSIPAPYNHSNIDSDEVLYYVDGDFMSRKNVTRGMITLHPGTLPPHADRKCNQH